MTYNQELESEGDKRIIDMTSYEYDVNLDICHVGVSYLEVMNDSCVYVNGQEIETIVGEDFIVGELPGDVIRSNDILTFRVQEKDGDKMSEEWSVDANELLR